MHPFFSLFSFAFFSAFNVQRKMITKKRRKKPKTNKKTTDIFADEARQKWKTNATPHWFVWFLSLLLLLLFASPFSKCLHFAFIWKLVAENEIPKEKAKKTTTHRERKRERSTFDEQVSYISATDWLIAVPIQLIWDH